MKTIFSITILSLIALLFFGCGTATEITGSWKRAGSIPKPARIMVTAFSSNIRAREVVERDLAASLNDVGVISLQSINTVPPTFSGEKIEDKKDELLEKIRGLNVDAILTVALVNKETETRYVPDSYSYAPITRFHYYGLFSGYYTTWYPTFFIRIFKSCCFSDETRWSALSGSCQETRLI